MNTTQKQEKRKSEAIPVAGRCEMLRIARLLENRLTDGAKVVSPIYRSRSTPQKLFFLPLVLISVRGWLNPVA
jgi:hypothetical protein